MIVGISGKKQSGKDTVGKIINILSNSPQLNNEGVLTFLRKDIITDSDWKIKKFADKLKDIVCLLIGCTREDLESEHFKNTELPEQWWYYKIYIGNGKYELTDYLNNDKSESWINIANPRYLVKTTPRLMLQLMGTECGREIIHPQVWVNSTFADYKALHYKTEFAVFVEDKQTVKKQVSSSIPVYPNWIITDMRFPNELQAIQSREGISIRIEKPWLYRLTDEGYHEFSDQEDRQGKVYRINPKNTKEEAEKIFKKDLKENSHISETALDEARFKYVINNDGTLEDLIDKVREILIKENIIHE